MPVSLDELERFLSYSVFCDRCGYNLRQLPYVGQCPECANHYNARPLKLQGIYSAFDLKFPWLDMMAGLISLGIGMVVLVESLRSGSRWGLISGLTFTVLGLAIAPGVYREVTRYVQFRGIIRRAQLEDDD